MSLMCRFKFVCDKRWEELMPIGGEPDVSFCGECRTSVYFCRSIKELDAHAKQGHCVAFGKRYEDVLMGVAIVPAWNNVDD